MHVSDLAETPPWEWPEDAADMLLRALRGDAADAEERLLAAELASSITVMNDEIAETLLGILCDPQESDAVRGTAAISLGPTLEEVDLEFTGFDEFDDELVSEPVAEAIRSTLREVYLDAAAPKEVRRRAIEAAVRAPEEWHAGAVRAAFHSGDAEWQLTAVFAMSYIRGFEDEIVEALQSDDPAIRHQAVRAAGNAEVRRAWPHVRAIVRDGHADKALLLAAIEAVASIRPKDAPRVLGDLVDSDDEEIADAVAEALGLAEGLDELQDDDW